MTLSSVPADARDRIMAGVWARAKARVVASRRKIDYRLYGRNLEFYNMRAPELMLSGPASTGKTISCLYLLDSLAREYPGFQGAILRKRRVDMDGSVLQSFKEKVLGPQTDVTVHGGEKAEWYDYPNGSRIWVGGLDKPGKVLSSERDGIYINQAEEVDLKDWETLISRATGRAGHMRDEQGIPFGLLFGDCNPDAPTHWIWSRHMGGQLKLIESRHQDNPMLYDQATGLITPEGERTMERLGRLTGYRRARLLDGRWTQAEGVVFDTWLDSENVTELAVYEKGAGPVFLLLDDGYSAGSAPDTRGRDPHTGQYVADAHPRVLLLAQEKPDGHLDVFYESTACLKLSDDHLGELLATIQENGWDMPQYAVHGPGQAEIRGRLFAAGIAPRQSMARVDESIKEMQSWIGADKNGWRRLRVNPACKNLRAEAVSYAYEPGSDKPVKAFDHSLDAVRGGCWTLRHNR